MLCEINSSFVVLVFGCFERSANEVESQTLQAGESRDLVYADTRAPLLKLFQKIVMGRNNLHRVADPPLVTEGRPRQSSIINLCTWWPRKKGEDPHPAITTHVHNTNQILSTFLKSAWSLSPTPAKSTMLPWVWT